MHPIERLRWVARAPDGDLSLAAAEAAEALAAFAREPAGLVIACRRLIERRPSSGPLWWSASRLLCALDPGAEASRVAAELEGDVTAVRLAGELPAGRVAVAGWPEHAATALRLRGGGPDQQVLVVDEGPAGRRLVRWFDAHGVEARVAGVDVAARRGVLVLLEAQALGPGGFVAAGGSGALAEAARAAGRPVWLVAGVGRALPAALYDTLVERVGRAAGNTDEALPFELVDAVAGPGGFIDPARAADRPGCRVAPELLRFPG